MVAKKLQKCTKTFPSNIKSWTTSIQETNIQVIHNNKDPTLQLEITIEARRPGVQASRRCKISAKKKYKKRVILTVILLQFGTQWTRSALNFATSSVFVSCRSLEMASVKTPKTLMFAQCSQHVPIQCSVLVGRCVANLVLSRTIAAHHKHPVCWAFFRTQCLDRLDRMHSTSTSAQGHCSMRANQS